MKTAAIIFLFAVTDSFNVPNDNKYIEAMTRNIQIVYSSQSVAELQNAVNAFERIAATEKAKWEPYYYAGFGYIMMANAEQNKERKDMYLDQATAVIKKANVIKNNDSEITALEGFVHMIRVTVDPSTRGQQYSGLAMQTFGKALSLNSENPRALALMAQMQFGTAQFLGSSTAEACASNKVALQKFNTFKSENPLAPQWGKSMADRLAVKCDK